MPFRSGKFSLSACASALLAAGLISLGATPAGAVTTTLTAVSATGSELDVLNGSGRAYYPVTGGAGVGYFLDTGDSSVPAAALDLSRNQDNDAAPSSSLMRFQIRSDKVVSPAAGEIAVLFVTTTGTVSTSPTQRLVPIATFGGSDQECITTDQCRGITDLSVGNDFFFAVRYEPNVNIQIGMYPQDLCRSYYADPAGLVPSGQPFPIGTGGGSALGCSNTTVLPNLTTSGSPMQLSFWIGTMSGSNVASLPALPSGTADAVLSVHFSNAPTPMACPADLTGSYFPGDSSILFNASLFRNSSAFPPQTKLVVTGRLGADPVADATYVSSDIVRRVNFGAAETIDGFTNKTDAADTSHDYNLGFMVRDQAGWVATSSCYLRGVQTSPVQGLLTQSSCFIATGAFGSADAEPVMLLRRFRDQVLLRNASGRAFVRWYYGWSPPAGEWLLSRPLFRLPVLLALAPLEVLAWLLLHPLWLAVLALGNGALVVTVVLRKGAIHARP
ncbi:MAG: hypothetical protein NDJ90_02960 [Oligoflexia bacterium]|nr:hypothetical protein [Oligoflexia bacterium]